MVRLRMFACRLSDMEYAALEELLELRRQVSNANSRSDLFRDIVLELKGRLERDGLHHLRYLRPKSELAVNF